MKGLDTTDALMLLIHDLRSSLVNLLAMHYFFQPIGKKCVLVYVNSKFKCVRSDVPEGSVLGHFKEEINEQFVSKTHQLLQMIFLLLKLPYKT